jgi:AcrR family transcriptional regulator
MNENKLDRRVKYTKNMLQNALVQLIKQQHISNISVKALCDLADINRSTFYAHYNDQYDLLHQVEEEVMANIRQHLEKDLPEEVDDMVPAFMLTRIFEYAKENADLFQVLLGENSDYLFQKDIIEFSQIVSTQYNKTLDARTKDYLKEFGTAGCISVVQKWLKDGTVESPEEISELIGRVLQQGMSAFGSDKAQ